MAQENRYVIMRKINGEEVEIPLTESEIDEIYDQVRTEDLESRIEEALEEIMGVEEATIFLDGKSGLYLDRLFDKVVEYEEQMSEANFLLILRSAIYEANKLNEGTGSDDGVFADESYGDLIGM